MRDLGLEIVKIEKGEHERRRKKAKQVSDQSITLKEAGNERTKNRQQQS